MYAQLGSSGGAAACVHRGSPAIQGVPLCSEVRELGVEGLQFRTVPGGRTGNVPDGDPGAFFTLGIMRDLVTGDAPKLGALAGSIIRAGGPDAIGSLRAWLAHNVRFTLDPDALELLQAPTYQLERIRADGFANGDCDDIAMMGAALGLAAGFAARFVLVKFDAAGPWEHVYTELEGAGGWHALDTSREQQRVPASVKPAALSTFAVGVPNGIRERVGGV